MINKFNYKPNALFLLKNEKKYKNRGIQVRK